MSRYKRVKEFAVAVIDANIVSEGSKALALARLDKAEKRLDAYIAERNAQIKRLSRHTAALRLLVEDMQKALHATTEPAGTESNVPTKIHGDINAHTE